MMWPAIAKTTRTVGSQTYGKYATQLLTWSGPKACSIGEDATARPAMTLSSSTPNQLHQRASLFLSRDIGERLGAGGPDHRDENHERAKKPGHASHHLSVVSA